MTYSYLFEDALLHYVKFNPDDEEGGEDELYDFCMKSISEDHHGKHKSTPIAANPQIPRTERAREPSPNVMSESGCSLNKQLGTMSNKRERSTSRARNQKRAEESRQATEE